MAKHIVDLDALQKAMLYMREVKSFNLADIEWQRKGVTVPVDPEAVKEWEFVGLGNKLFAEDYFFGGPRRFVSIFIGPSKEESK